MLLTLDLATVLGWTRGDVADRNFESGYYKLPSTGADIGAFAEAYDKWIRSKINGVTEIVMECPVLPRKTTLATVRKLTGLAWHSEWIATSMGIRCYEAHLSSVKKAIGGHGRASKDDMVAAVQGYGYNVTEENEADAIAVRLYTIMTRYNHLADNFELSMGLLGGRKIELTIPVPQTRPSPSQLLGPED